jgi:hypothetical protein
LKGTILSTEFQKYSFADFLRASALAPLASIPAVLVVDLLILFLQGDIPPSDPQKGLAAFRAWAILLMVFSLPSAYVSAAIFGPWGIRIANSAKARITIPIAAIAGVVCGVITGLLWMTFLAALWRVILMDTIVCGLFVGVAYAKLLNRSVQRKSTR